LIYIVNPFLLGDKSLIPGLIFILIGFDRCLDYSVLW